MSIRIKSTTVTTKIEVVLQALSTQTAEAQLLGKGGEEIERFSLTNGINHLPLKRHPPGAYALRVSTDNEVAVKEIIIRE